MDKVHLDYVFTLLNDFINYSINNNNFDECHQCCIFACLIRNSSIYDHGSQKEIDFVIRKYWIRYFSDFDINIYLSSTIKDNCVSILKNKFC